MILYYTFGFDEFEYEVYDNDIVKVLVANNIIGNKELELLSNDEIDEDQLFKLHKDFIIDYFEDSARIQYKDYKLEKADSYSYYGVSRQNFH